MDDPQRIRAACAVHAMSKVRCYRLTGLTGDSYRLFVLPTIVPGLLVLAPATPTAYGQGSNTPPEECLHFAHETVARERTPRLRAKVSATGASPCPPPPPRPLPSPCDSVIEDTPLFSQSPHSLRPGRVTTGALCHSAWPREPPLPEAERMLSSPFEGGIGSGMCAMPISCMKNTLTFTTLSCMNGPGIR